MAESEETGAQENNPREPSGQKIGPDGFLRIQLPRIYHPRSDWVLECKASLLEVKDAEEANNCARPLCRAVQACSAAHSKSLIQTTFSSFFPNNTQ